MSTSQITTEVLELAQSELATCAVSLLDSLEHVDAGFDEEWQEEIQRRIEDLDSGKVVGIPHAEVMESARQALRAMRCE